MAAEYISLSIYSSEGARFRGMPVYKYINSALHDLKIAARCIVTRGIEGCFENGAVAASSIEVGMINMPLKIEIIAPEAEKPSILEIIDECVLDGIVTFSPVHVYCYRASKTIFPKNLKVRDLMTANPVTVKKETTLLEILKLYIKMPFKCLPVVDKKSILCGIITQDDLIKRGGLLIRPGLFSELSGLNVDECFKGFSAVSAADIMSCDLNTISAEKRLSDAIELMVKDDLKRLPVVDENSVLVGIISRYDILKSVSKNSGFAKSNVKNTVEQRALKASDLMDAEIEAVEPDTPVKEIIKSVDFARNQRIPVLDKDGHLKGLIFDRDILRLLGENSQSIWESLINKVSLAGIFEGRKKHLSKLASDIMHTDFVFVNENTSLEESVQLMLSKGLKRLPVLDEKGIFKGILRRSAILKSGCL